MSMIVGTDRTKKPKTWKRFILPVIIFLIITADLIPPYGGNLFFYYRWARCGSKPYQPNGGVFGNRYYVESPTLPQLLRYFSGPFYCTPLEAEQAGLSSRPDKDYRPHLDKWEQQNNIAPSARRTDAQQTTESIFGH